MFLKAAEGLGMPPTSCLVVEDAPAGISAAVAGSFKCACIGAAAHAEKCDYPLNKLSDLLHIVSASNN